MKLENVTPVPMRDFETSDSRIAEAKGNRNRKEFMWTISSVFTYYVFTHYEHIEYITYLDADLYFYDSPEIIFEDMGKHSILITPHNLRAKEQESVVGKYNVGMVVFKNDDNGRACLKWWQSECLTWCYDLPLPDKFGDQKYLDYFEEKFKNVFVYRNKGADLARWNIENYKGKIRKKNGRFIIDGDKLIFFHFSQWEQYYPDSFFLPFGPLHFFGYVFLLRNIPTKLIYREYAKAISVAMKRIRKIVPDFTSGTIPRPSTFDQIREIIKIHPVF
jgi:hypothetical protein